MMSIDLKNNVKVEPVIPPISPSATGVITGLVIDLSDCAGVIFAIQSGLTTTDTASATPIVKEGSVTGTLVSAPDSVLIGTEAEAVLAGDAEINSVATVGYKGASRYVTCNLDCENAASGVWSVVAIKYGLRKKPAS